MKNTIFLLIINLFSSLGFSQAIYSDSFNEGINNFTSSSSLTTSIDSGNQLIVGDGTAGPWNNITYLFHNSEGNINVNMTASPKLFIKVKAENSPIMRIDLIDTNGYVTNASPSSISPNLSYQIFEIDFSEKLRHTKASGPCASSLCVVNISEIRGIMIFLNPGTGAYNGTIDIEWLSIGEPLNDVEAGYQIRYNQVGYLENRNKIINIVSPDNFEAKSFVILNSNDEQVLSGNTNTPSLWADSNEYVAKADVSTINSPGVYKFKTEALEISFNVGSDVYESISEAALKYYYYNRASTSITSEFGGIHARNMGHPDTQVLVHSSAASPERPEGTIISSPKGWYDAGDYNKYIVNSGISTYTLLAAFEHYESYYISKSIDIPETGDAIPDLLDEIKWNLDWMLSMQDPFDGGVYHKLTGLNFAGRILPEAYLLDRYVVQKSTAAALDFAAVLSMASRVYSAYDTELSGYSTILLNAAKSAYTWAEANPDTYFSNPAGVSTGQYGDTNLADEFQWAAVELFITTGDEQYKNVIDITTITRGGALPSWRNTEPLALVSIMFHEALLSSEINTSAARIRLVNTANTIRSQVETSVMNTSMASNNYVWGSNSNVGNQILLLVRAFEITKDESYLDAAYTAMDYILGRNGTGFCYVTGFGDKQVMNSHHRISDSDGVALPVPGMLAGGPHTGQQDISACVAYPANFNASSYFDDWCSFSTNEVAINWNASLAYSINALQFYQNQQTLSVPENSLSDKNIQIYPNPTSGIVQFNNIENINSIKIFDLSGREVSAIKILKNNIIDIQSLEEGIYLIVFKTSNGFLTKKIVKKD